jgi:hypothetical protein
MEGTEEEYVDEVSCTDPISIQMNDNGMYLTENKEDTATRPTVQELKNIVDSYSNELRMNVLCQVARGHHHYSSSKL